MSTRSEVLSLSGLALFALAPAFATDSLIMFPWAGPMARASAQSRLLSPPPGCRRTVPQPHPPFSVVLLVSDSANPEKREFRTNCPLVPLIKKRIAAPAGGSVGWSIALQRKDEGSIPDQGLYLGCRFGPQLRRIREAAN